MSQNPIPRDLTITSASPVEDWDFPQGTTCNPENPEECEACQ